MLDTIINFILVRHWRANKKKQDFLDCLQSEVAEGFLYILLNLMSLIFILDKDFRRNIENFNARYLFKDKDNRLCVGVIFENSKLKVVKKAIEKTNVTVVFRDERSLANFLLSDAPDILNAILKQEIDFTGNINYINRFAYMAMHLKLQLTSPK